MSKNTPDRPQYQLMQDTPYITQARDVSNKGYQGFNQNYQNVNVFSPEANRSIQANADAVYKRAEDDFARNYNDTMRRLATRNYNQFGTLNATAPSYITDMQNLQSQRALMDSAYNKALYAEQLRDDELARRYNTLNMYKQMYDYGSIPYQQDVMNYKTQLRNQDIAYQNALGGGSSGKSAGSIASPLLSIGGGVLGSMLGQVGSMDGSAIGSTLGNALSSTSGNSIANVADQYIGCSSNPLLNNNFTSLL